MYPKRPRTNAERQAVRMAQRRRQTRAALRRAKMRQAAQKRVTTDIKFKAMALRRELAPIYREITDLYLYAKDNQIDTQVITELKKAFDGCGTAMGGLVQAGIAYDRYLYRRE